MLRYLEVLHRTGSLVGLTDWELLDRFQEARRTGDRSGTQAAFEAIVERHGAMVWHVCRSLATDEHDAEDAFQATYLILVRKADGLRLIDACRMASRRRPADRLEGAGRGRATPVGRACRRISTA
jgi:DNA-directed RNA polymerase specialized sigma24 family protein